MICKAKVKAEFEKLLIEQVILCRLRLNLLAQPSPIPDAQSLAVKVRPELLRALAVLSERRQAEVLDFARFLGQPAEKNTLAEVTPEAHSELRLAPPDTLLRLTGLVALGGDALVDSGSSTSIASSMKPSERVSSPHLPVP